MVDTRMRNVRWALAALTVAATFATIAPASAGPAEEKAAKELTRLVIPEDAYRAMIEQMTTQMLATVGGGGNQMPPDAARKLKAVVTEAMPYDEMVNMNAEIYASKFTAGELGELTKFYKTPVGQKAAKLLPEISGEAMRKLGPVIMGRMPGLMKKHGLVPQGQ